MYFKFHFARDGCFAHVETMLDYDVHFHTYQILPTPYPVQLNSADPQSQS
jgi:hypothetical protein